ncbi:16S rRNA (cytidine(1402)-2'-O)-methyltransferase [Anaerospora hongkongensis]|uniref:16S rRNA (cytidine(1402)-2'-O)-methyltransferase n=1 Tax=Anaerospora hongkongensis TaxID=244830 RepID=UPI00289AF3C6|nr:16S rRNA (cytidine(1402)-2'-O)-methyltransferase [Anaerospora hongkongensis]
MNALQGVLYLCATPIGNLEDITFRAVRVLKEANLIAAEDTRHTRKLLNHYEIHTATVSYHEHNKLERGPELINRLLQGQTIALVSDAGMPGISDPGTHLTQLAIEAGITVIPVPGANAALSALIASGLDTTNFTFVGFLPKTKKKRRELLEQLAKQPYTLLFYESPHRIKETLKELETAFGDRPAAACRELTKKFEEFNRSTLLGLQQHFAAVEPRGEFTLVVQGAGAGPEPDLGSKDEVSLPEAVALLMAKGAAKKDALRQVAVDRGISRRDVYQAVLEAEK